MKLVFTLNILVLSMLLVSCATSQLDRLEWLGRKPEFNPVQPKIEDKNKPIQWPAAKVSEYDYLNNSSTPNSLWATTSKGFFKDQRARAIGDILMVKVELNDQARLDNRTQRKRVELDTTKVPNLFGLEEKLFQALPGEADPSNLIGTNTNLDNRGEGQIQRREQISTDIAAVVTDVMPNGNLLIYGSQEIRVNYETRQLTIQGVIRPEDISPKNDILYSQIAEARISYGGKGVIDDIQQPRIGSQVVDILSPF